MDIMKWQPGRDVGPWRRLRDIEEEMDSLVGRVLGREPSGGRERVWAPAVDLRETKTEVIVKAELPEIDPKNVDITVEGDILTLRGERKAEEEKKEGDAYYTERSWGSFVRSLRLPKEVDEAGTKASYKDGVLSVIMPKKKEEKAKQIKVNVE